MPDIDFADIAAKAEAFINSESATPAGQGDSTPPAEPTPAAEPTPDASVADAAPVTQPTPKELELADDAIVVVKNADGSVEKLTAKQLRDERMMRADYSKKTAEVATQRKEVEKFVGAYEKLVEERKQLEAFLSNPQQVLEFLHQTQPQLFQAPQDPNEIATVEQAQSIAAKQVEARAKAIEQQLADLKKATTDEIHNATSELETKRAVAELSVTINEHLESLFKEYPILSAVDGVEDIIRWQVHEMKPASMEDCKAAFTRVAKAQVDKLEAKFAELNKEKLVAKDKLKTNAIEPPGGTGVQPQPATFKKADGSIDWNKLAQSAAAFMDSGGKG